jgi:dTDP-glucose 4,6-dehydratase
MTELGTHYKRVLVTGGAGFIGINFLRMLLSRELKLTADRVIVADSLTYASNPAAINTLNERGLIEFHKGDISDSDFVDSILPEVELIINFAAESHVDKSIESSDKFIRSNVMGVNALIEGMRKHKVRKFLQVSTDEVYGSITEGSWDEQQEMKPNSPYSASKASGDLIALAHAKTHGLDIRITRCSNNYGPFQNIEKFIPKCITQISSGLAIPVYGKGDQTREWIFVDDHCRGIDLVIESGKPGNIYNIGSGFEMTNLEMVELLGNKMNVLKPKFDYVEDRKGHDFRYSLNFEKLKKLGFNPKVNLEIGLQATIDWYSGNQKLIIN